MCGLILTVAASGCTPKATVESDVSESDVTAQDTAKKELMEKESTEKETADSETAVTTATTATTTPQKSEDAETTTLSEEAPLEDSIPANIAADTNTQAASNNALASSIQVTDLGIGGLTAVTPFSAEAIQATFPNMDVTMQTQSIEGVDYPVIVVSDGDAGKMEIEPTSDAALIYRIKAIGAQFSGLSGHTVGDTFESVYGSTTPDSCVAGMDAAAGFVLCLAPSSQNVQYAFAGGWNYTFDQLPDEAALSDGVLQQIVWIPGNF